MLENGGFLLSFYSKEAMKAMKESISFSAENLHTNKEKNKQKNEKVLKIAPNLVHYLADISFEFRVISLLTTTKLFLIMLQAY